MTLKTTRRHFLLGTTSTLLACAPQIKQAEQAKQADDANHALLTIETRVGGRLGVFASDTGSSTYVGYRENERFAMCSTFKWILAAAILSRVDRNELSLDEHIPYSQEDLLDYAPIAKVHLDKGSLSIGDLARAAVVVSDNTAANLLLSKIGGPIGFTRFVRDNNDDITRLDRTEPELNDVAPSDLRDTTSPRAMVGLMSRVLCGDVLTPGSCEQLLVWLRSCETGNDRLRAGLPPSWVVGDKTGSGPRGTCNDVAIAVPPGKAPIVIAAYICDSMAEVAELNAAHAAVARVIVEAFSL